MKNRMLDDIEVKKKDENKIFNIPEFIERMNTFDMRPRTSNHYVYYLIRFQNETLIPSKINNLEEITLNNLTDFASKGGMKDKKKRRKRSFIYFALKKYFTLFDIDFVPIEKEFKKKYSKKKRHPKHDVIKFIMPEHDLNLLVGGILYRYERVMPKKGSGDCITSNKIPLDDIDKMKRRVLVRMLYYGGFRISELLLLHTSDIGFGKYPLPVYIPEEITKTEEGRIVYIRKDVADELKKYVTEAKLNKNDYVFTFIDFKGKSKSIKDIIRETTYLDWYLIKYANEANLVEYTHLKDEKNKSKKNISNHKLRHAFAHWLKSLGYTIEEIQKMMGHGSIEMTGKYIYEEDDTIRKRFIKLVEKTKEDVI